MVQVYLRLNVAAERVHETVQALRTVMLPARQSAECAGVRLCADVENPTVLHYFEDWRTPEALRREFRLPRFARVLEVTEASEDHVMEFRFYSETQGLEYVEALRAHAGPFSSAGRFAP
jgi:quinol monooxygenase YgiN